MSKLLNHVSGASRWMTALAALSAVLLAFAPNAVAAEQALRSTGAGQANDADLDRVWRHATVANLIRDYKGPPQWLPEGDRFVHWAVAGPNAGTWVIVDARTGRQDPVIAPSDLKAQLSALGSAADNPGANYQLNTKENRIVFQNGNTVLALDLASRRIAAGSSKDIGGKPLGASPDGRYVLTIRTDMQGVHEIPIVDYQALETVTMAPYAKTGTPLPRTEFVMFDTTTGKEKSLPAVEGEGYAWVAGWRPDGKEGLVLRLSRDGKRLDLIGFDPVTATSRVIVREERPESFVAGLEFSSAWQRQMKPLDGDRGFLWMSERDGWRHVYHYDWSGKLQRQVTSGKYVVQQVIGVTPDGKDAFVLASADGPTPYDRNLYKASLAGGAMKRISTQPGDHDISVSPSGLYYTVRYSTLTQPPRAAVAAVAGGPAHQYAEADVSQLSTLGLAPMEAFTAKATDGKTILHGVIFKPRRFDPSKRYPVINWVYSGPFMTIVPHGYAPTTMVGMASQIQGTVEMGFIVVMVDGRGTPGRSKAFQDVNYGRIGQTEIPDQVAAVRQAAAARPYMDLDRVGIFGHSWGGYFATRGMLTAPDFYKAGYAGAQGMLEEAAMINELNMGLPANNPRGYEEGSNVRIAGNLKGAYKMMHGTSDTNASLSTTMRMADALIKANKHFELLIMPGVQHGPPPSLRRYHFEDQMRFFARHLGGPR